MMPALMEKKLTGNSDSEQQEQMMHRHFVRPDYQMDFIEIRDVERLLGFCESFGIKGDNEDTLSKYFKSEVNTIIFDNEKNRILVFDELGNIVDAFFPVS